MRHPFPMISASAVPSSIYAHSPKFAPKKILIHNTVTSEVYSPELFVHVGEFRQSVTETNVALSDPVDELFDQLCLNPIFLM